MELNSITCIDIFVGLQLLKDNSVQVIIADIPYFEIVEEDWDNQWSSFGHYMTWLDALFVEFARVLKSGGACYVYCAITYYPQIQLCLNEHLNYAFTITWKKQRSRGSGWGFNREEICVNVKGKHVFHEVETTTLMLPHLRKGKLDYSNGGRTVRKRDHKLATSIWDDVVQVCSYRKQLHPTEKPVENARRMLEASSQPGDTILIPFVGSGSECEACIRLNRSYIGFDADQRYCDIARQRISDIPTIKTIEVMFQ